ncbi:MAG: hypothetical protein ACRDL7_14790, partial [Gaiellaceae bacterium]
MSNVFGTLGTVRGTRFGKARCNRRRSAKAPRRAAVGCSGSRRRLSLERSLCSGCTTAGWLLAWRRKRGAGRVYGHACAREASRIQAGAARPWPNPSLEPRRYGVAPRRATG